MVDDSFPIKHLNYSSKLAQLTNKATTQFWFLLWSVGGAVSIDTESAEDKQLPALLVQYSTSFRHKDRE